MTNETKREDSPRAGRGLSDAPSGHQEKQLYALLARYMDLKAFAAKKVGKQQAEALKVRREIANKRAKAAVRFFLKPDNLARLNAHASALGARTHV